MERFIEFLNYTFSFSEDVQISVKSILVLVVVLFATSIFLRLIRKFITRNLPPNDKLKFISLFSYSCTEPQKLDG